MTDPASNSADPAPAGAFAAHAAPVAGALRRSRRLWRAVAVLALAVAALALWARFGAQEAAFSPYVARIVIDGTIATDPERVKVLEELGEDERVKAVILAINSPGGTTAGGEELYETITALRAKKPVVAVIKELGASAAYMTAIAADRIWARRLSIVGSIGVLYQHVDAGKLLNTIGVDLDKVASGPLKAEPDFDEPISPAVRQSLESLIGDSFDWFVDIVAERRGLTRPATLALADGRIVTGRQGVEAGLIDAIGGEAEAQAWLESYDPTATYEDEHPKGLIETDLPIRTVYPEPDGGFGWAKFLGGQARAAIGLAPQGPIVLDGLVSLWQVGPSS